MGERASDRGSAGATGKELPEVSGRPAGEQGERELRESRETFMRLVEEAPFGVYVIDSAFRIVQVSAGCEEVFRPFQPIIGRDLAEVLRTLWPESFAEEALARFRHTLETGEPYRSPDTTERRANIDAEESYDWQLKRLRLPGGEYGVVCYFYDLTKARRTEHALRASQERYRLLFNSIDEGFCTFDVIFDEQGKAVDYRFVEVNPAFERLTGLVDAVGKRMRELSPDHEQVWFDVYGRVARTGEPIRFTQQAKSLKGRTYDLYAFRVDEPHQNRVAVLFEDITERRRIETALRESEARYRLLVERAAGYAILMLDREGRINSWNTGAARMFGYEEHEIVGRPLADLFENRDELSNELEEARYGETASREGWRIRKDGSRFWATGVMTALTDNGRTRGFVKVLRDHTESKRYEQRLETITRELNHRVRNLLAVVQATALQTIKHSSTMHEFRETFDQRLRAMAQAHSLVTETEWTGVGLRELVLSEVEHRVSEASQADVAGASLTFKPDAALTMHMVIHELATNATKYGALSSPEGRLVVRWKLAESKGSHGEGGQRVELTWEELGGPPVEPPTRTGYGTVLIDTLLSYQLNAQLERDYAEGGFRCAMSIPWTDEIALSPPATHPPAAD